MSSFHDMLASDIENVFMNKDEFAEWHEIEGERTLVIWDSDSLKELKASIDLSESTLLIRAASKDLPARRPTGQVLNIDGKEYTIDDWSVDMGMATIILSEPLVG